MYYIIVPTSLTMSCKCSSTRNVVKAVSPTQHKSQVTTIKDKAIDG